MMLGMNHRVQFMEHLMQHFDLLLVFFQSISSWTGFGCLCSKRPFKWSNPWRKDTCWLSTFCRTWSSAGRKEASFRLVSFRLLSSGRFSGRNSINWLWTRNRVDCKQTFKSRRLLISCWADWSWIGTWFKARALSSSLSFDSDRSSPIASVMHQWRKRRIFDWTWEKIALRKNFVSFNQKSSSSTFTKKLRFARSHRSVCYRTLADAKQRAGMFY